MNAVDALVAGVHHNPHSLLGPHERDGELVVRVWRPAAEAVAVVADDGDRLELRRTRAEGLFEGTLQAGRAAYRVEAEYRDGTMVAAPDPYAFRPTLGELDLHLLGEGRHERVHDALGARVTEVDGVAGTAFAVWAPNARGVGVVGDFNLWNPLAHPMRALGGVGVWELFLPGVGEGERYKFAVRHADGSVHLKADPLARYAERPPAAASIVFRSRHEWRDEPWLGGRAAGDSLREPMSVYEVHLGSWRLNPLEGNRSLTYLELADELGEYVADLGFTHVELLPVMQHPYAGSWGYQVTGYFAPQSTFGTPDDFRAFVDRLHARGIGVLLDWVPAHFPRDEWALARFDGTALYEHDDPRRGAHPDWGTLVFNLGRTEVRNFL
ncbi:MAG: 1,4-alpha-glucan branching enzyme, partial [Thermoleophilia bacterium]|nr:1,4-alpha-glucan branching enzyme [Thermoleophilia bacterium]